MLKHFWSFKKRTRQDNHMNSSYRSFDKNIRQIRIFISSSFEDMDRERNYLRDNIFPILREKARRRGVAVTALDLRWGIPEGTDLGETIEICMNEIDNSYPFFIGIVGKNYGTRPDINVFNSSAVLKEKFGVLKGYFKQKLSITDMEMRYGVLDCSHEDRNLMDALFLLRAEDAQEIDRHKNLKKLREDIETCGEQYEKLSVLKGDHNVLMADYSTVEEMGDVVRDVFENILDRNFPENDGQGIDADVKNRQLATISELTKFYIPIDEQLRKITTFVENSSAQHLLITGESGSGKSSLLAYWIHQNTERLKNEGTEIICHFVGDEADNDSKNIITRVVNEIIELFKLNWDKNDELTLWNVFKNKYYSRITKDLVIIIDAINQFPAEENLNWIPTKLPNNVKIIYSSLPDATINDKISKNDAISIYGLADQSRDIRKEMIERYIFDFHRRKITDNNIKLILDWPLSNNPLALRTFLDELLVVGQYDNMESIIQCYTTTQSIDELFSQIINRIISNERYSWVQEALALIASTMYGLSESEIQQLTEVHILHWSSFYCSFRRHFIVKNGLITFSHQYLSEAVNRKFLDTNLKKETYHKILIPFFKTADSVRNIEELLNLCTEAQIYSYELYNILSNPAIFSYLYKRFPEKIILAWSNLYRNEFDIKGLIVDFEKYIESFGVLEFSLDVNIYYGEYVKFILEICGELYLTEYSNEIYKYYIQATKNPLCGYALMDWCPVHREMGNLCMSMGYFAEAIYYYKKGIPMEGNGNGFDCFGFSVPSLGYSEDEDKQIFDLGSSSFKDWFYCIGECYRRLGQYDQAIKFLNIAIQEAQHEHEATGDKVEGMANIYWSLYKIYDEQGEPEIASEYKDKCNGESGYIDTIADMYIENDHPRFAFLEYHKLLKRHKLRYGKNDIQFAIDYYNIGRSYFNGNVLDVAYRCYDKAIAYLKNNNVPYLYANISMGKALCFYNDQNYIETYNQYIKSASIYKSIGLYPDGALAQYYAAVVLTHIPDYDNCRGLLKEILDDKNLEKYCTKHQISRIVDLFDEMTHGVSGKG